MSQIKIPIAEATNAQLLYYAQSILNIDVKAGANTATLVAKIEQAQPDITEISVRAEDSAKPVAVAIAPESEAAPAPAIPTGIEGNHWKFDPVVRLKILPASDNFRSREVPIPVGGDLFLAKRNVEIDLPYRFYEALDHAIEMVANDTDEIHPDTQLPIKEYVDQHSYPFFVISEPSPADLAAWRARQ